MCVLLAPRKWYLWLFISFRGAIKYSLYPQSSETNEPRLRSNRSWQIFLNNVYLLTVTFTSLRMVPLACDFHCLKPGSVSSAGISFSLCKTLQNFALVCLSGLFSSSSSSDMNKKEKERGWNEGRRYSKDVLHKFTQAGERKGQSEEGNKYSREKWSITFSLFYDSNVEILLAFPKFKLSQRWTTNHMFNDRLKEQCYTT